MMTTDEYRIDNLSKALREARVLVGLMEDPHPGLMSWNDALWAAYQRLKGFMEVT